MSTQMRTWFT